MSAETRHPVFGAERSGSAAFTLAELLVVMAVISMSLLIVLPTIASLFTSGAEEQAISVLAGGLSAARGSAIRDQSYGLLHVQIGRDDDKCWMVVMRYDRPTGRFISSYWTCPEHPEVRLAEKRSVCPHPDCHNPLQPQGAQAQRMPGDAAFGEVVDSFITPASGGDSGDSDSFNNVVNTDEGFKDFTTFNVIFAADGSLVSDIEGAAPQLYSRDPVFEDVGSKQRTRVWQYQAASVNEKGTRVMTVFDYKKLKVLGDRTKELNKSRLLVVNPYTGQFISTE